MLLIDGVGHLSGLAEEIEIGRLIGTLAKGVFVEGIIGVIQLITQSIVGLLEIKTSESGASAIGLPDASPHHSRIIILVIIPLGVWPWSRDARERIRRRKKARRTGLPLTIPWKGRVKSKERHDWREPQEESVRPGRNIYETEMSRPPKRVIATNLTASDDLPRRAETKRT